MLQAFIKTDGLDDPEVVQDLHDLLLKFGLQPHHTERDWRSIYSPFPFLYFRNPYIRIENPAQILNFHYKNLGIPYIKTINKEIISVNPTADGLFEFVINCQSSYYEPKKDPLPILIGLHKRKDYAKLTLRSLLYSFQSNRQKLYIVMSEPDQETENYVRDLLEKNSTIEAVISKENLGYAFANFGSKFFKLDKFVHFEDDGILPENIQYFIPHWTSQLDHRSNTASFASLKVSSENYTSEYYQSEMYIRGKTVVLPQTALWHYATYEPNIILPVGGLGCVIDSRRMYKDFQAPNFFTCDHNIIKNGKMVCIANVSVYHLGPNQEIDYPDYFKEKRTGFTLKRYYEGIDMRSSHSKIIDLAADYDQVCSQ